MISGMKKYSIVADIALVSGLLVLIAAPSFAVTMPNVGAAAGYAVLDSSTPNAQAKADAQNAYNQILAMTCTKDMTDQNINNQQLTAGVYCFSTPTFFQGQVLFDAKGDTNAVFVMKMANRFDAWSDSHVVLLNGAQAQNIFWLAGGAATLGDNVDFAGTVITMAPISFGRGGNAPIFDEHGKVNGRLWSIGSTVTVPSRVTVGFVAPLPNIYTIPQQYQQQPTQVVAQQSNNALLSVIVNEPGFTPFVNGIRVTSGMKTPFAAGTYTISEINTSATNYGAPTFSGSCTQNGLTGTITLNGGDDKVCVINNTPVMGWAAAPVAVCGKGECAPKMPNTGLGGSYLPMINMIGLLLVAGFVWTETSFGRRLV
ncbi:MAG: DUF3494 domain-containing protein [Candidatus Pacebacteria bacterium]|nr:DUF3494 domain-containing protein [Candidatus Paceibacterota bacterium]